MDTAGADPGGYTTEGYFGLAASGAIGEEDRVELLEGVVVSSPPQAPLHSAVLMAVCDTLTRIVAGRASIRTQMPFLAGPRSVPEPDLAVVAGRAIDYRDRHPSEALLVVEVSEDSLAQDRLTKSRIYAAAGVPEYWIVNLRDRCVEVYARPEPARRVYAAARRVGRDCA